MLFNLQVAYDLLNFEFVTKQYLIDICSLSNTDTEWHQFEIMCMICVSSRSNSFSTLFETAGVCQASSTQILPPNKLCNRITGKAKQIPTRLKNQCYCVVL